MEETKTYCAFAGFQRLAAGPLEPVLRAAKQHVESGGQEPLFFELQTGRQIEFELQGNLDEVLARALAEHEPSEAPRVGPGRPKLGVVSREVSLLPRHWEWLEGQSGGASAALRRLVESARKSGPEQAKRAREAASKLMWALAGNQPNFEEATRALFAKQQERLEELVHDWPCDLRDQVLEMTRAAALLEVKTCRP